MPDTNISKKKNPTPWIKMQSEFHPWQQAEHVKAFTTHVFEQDQAAMTKLKDKTLKLDPFAVSEILKALKG